MTYFKTRLQEYLDQYPQFLDKSPDSNFTRQTMVYNKQRKELLQQCNNLRLSQDLNRPLQIQKIQNQSGLAVFNFYVYIENIKEVKIEQYNKENTMTVLVDETFTKENVNNYSYSTTLTSTSEIIPYSNFKLIVDTYDEYHYEKGYPENNIIQGNEYDHDTALDKLGKLLGVERYKHIEVGESDLYKTLPSYFDGATEDDYYYQERIKEYVSRFGVTSLPQLDFWKRFGYDVEMYNRKRLLVNQGGVEDLKDCWVYDKNSDLYCCFIDCDNIDSIVDTSRSIISSSVRLELENIINYNGKPKKTITVLKEELQSVLDNWSNPPQAPYSELTRVIGNTYSGICGFKKDIQLILDRYMYLQYSLTSIKDLSKDTYYFDTEKQLLYVKDNPYRHSFRVYKGTGSYMVNDNTSDAQLDKYMCTKNDYNSDVYDVNLDYNKFHSNLLKPSNNDVQLIFNRNMPLTKKVVIDVSLNYASRNIGAFGDNVKYKVGNTIIGSNMAFSEYCILCESIEITDTGDLNQINSDNDRYWYVLLDSKGDLYILEDTNVNRIEAELKLDMDGNLIMEATS